MKKITDYAELVKAKHALNKTIAPVEDGANITGSYTSGKQFIREGVLYTALTTIAANTAWSSLTLDTDYELADDLTSQLASLNQTLTNYANSQSNPNLLDNPFFTVNQRGTAKDVSITTTAITKYLDRWWINTGRTFTYNSNESITSADLDLWQILDIPFDIAHLGGKTVTASVMYSDGTIESGNHTIRNSVPSENVFTQVSGNTSKGINIVIGELSNGLLQVSVLSHDNISATIKAVKLELGTVSTLAHDSAPDYALELAKCRTSTADSADTFANQGQINVGTPNPNLLDNPWFTVNQRGFSTSNASGFTVDRWQVLQAAGTISLVNGAISIEPTVSGTVFLWGQTIEDAHSKLAGKTVTLSVMLSDGTIKSKSFDYPTDSPSDRQINNVHLGSTHYFELYEYSSGHARVGYFNDGGAIPSAPITIKAVKLELGSVSTLAQDTAPNYQQELAKCMRYYQRLGRGEWVKGDADRTCLWMVKKFDVPMRAIPTVTIINQSISFYGMIIDNNVDTTAISKGLEEISADAIGFIQLLITSSHTITSRTIYSANIDFLEASADL